jgi:hypothetical protein
MKHLKIMPAVLTVLLAMAIPSIAAAQYHDERLDKFVNERPELRAQLQQNPNLIYNKEWREKHPDLRAFMQNHPNIWGKLPDNGRWGAYGPDHDWHEADWWHQHDPGWMYSNHPEWAQNHPDWRGDGDFDEHHEWHDRDWWHDHHPDWVDKHHPDWYKHPYEHPIAAEEHKHEVEHEHHQDNPGHPDHH